MDVYKDIKKNIKEHLTESGNESLAKISGKVIDIYINRFQETLFIYGRAYVRSIRSYLYVNIKPITFLNHSMYKNMLISPLNSNYLFEIKMNSKYLKKYKFTFKSMSKLKYFFQQYTLKTNRVYNLINDYEKSLL